MNRGCRPNATNANLLGLSTKIEKRRATKEELISVVEFSELLFPSIDFSLIECIIRFKKSTLHFDSLLNLFVNFSMYSRTWDDFFEREPGFR